MMRRLFVSDVLEAVSAEAGLSVADLTGPARQHRVSHARQLAMLMIRERWPRVSYQRVANLLGRQDKTTALYGHGVAAARIKIKPAYRALYEAASARLERRAAP